MIIEKMLELLLLEKYKEVVEIDSNKINRKELMRRLYALRREFIEPYVIKSTSKE